MLKPYLEWQYFDLKQLSKSPGVKKKKKVIDVVE